MGWIEQTKKGSRKSGGPQYYLQDLNESCVVMLAHKLRCPVRLWTPYGIIDTGLTAVSTKVGSVGHDRVQSGGKVPNVAFQIAHWYGLAESDIEHIEFEDTFDHDSAFVMRPSHFKLFGRRQRRVLSHDTHPLTIVRGNHSSLLLHHLRDEVRVSRLCREWAQSQITGLVADHDRRVRNLDERDLLRASGALSKLGIDLGMYRSKGIDCPDAAFSLGGFPRYSCQIEIEERSSSFLAGHHAAAGHHRQRTVVLCMRHDAEEALRRYVDVIELRELSTVLQDVA